MHNNTLCDCLFYSLLFVCAGAQHVAYSNSVCCSTVSFCIFLSFLFDAHATIAGPKTVSVSVPCVASVSAEVTIPTETYRQPASRWNRCLVPQRRALTFSIFFLSYSPPTPTLFILEVGAARGLLQDSQTKVVTAEIAIKATATASTFLLALSSGIAACNYVVCLRS